MGGRYAYDKQPMIAQWNMCRFAEALLPLLADDEDEALDRAKRILGGYLEDYETAFLSGMRKKIGLTIPDPGDSHLVQELLDRMADDGADYTSTFRALSDEDPAAARKNFSEPEAFDAWRTAWAPPARPREPVSVPDRAASMPSR